MAERDHLVRRMTVPPLRPEDQPLRTSYDAFREVFTDLKADGDAQILTQSERAKELWDEPNPDL